MQAKEQEIHSALVELGERVNAMSGGGPKPDLLPLFARLDKLTSELPRGTAPELLHYLHKKSYEKARLWLEGRDAENAAGNCGHT